MTDDIPTAPFARLTPDDIAQLRELFDRVGFANDPLLEMLGEERDLLAISEADRPLLLHRTSGGTPLELLVRFFLMCETIREADLAAAIAPMTVEKWVAGGVAEPFEDGYRCVLRLLPVDKLRVAYDPRWRFLEGESDFVMGVGRSSLTLATISVRKPCKAALDLGTGSGFLALMAAEHADRVVATDMNPRALDMTRFNAALNGFDIDVRAGNLFEPVDGEKFDLVVSNPPFVISPDAKFIYRDSGLGEDLVTRRICEQVGEYLSEGGFCHILCNWAHVKDTDWQERLAEWFVGAPCDVLVLRSETRPVDIYAIGWLRHTERNMTDDVARFNEWLTYYQQHGMEQISGGSITLRRRTVNAEAGDPPNWVEFDDTPTRMLGPSGDDIARRFDAETWLRRVENDLEAFFAATPRLAERVKLRQAAAAVDGVWQVGEEVELERTQGMAYTARVDPYIASFVAQCNGERTMRELTNDLADGLGRPLADVVGPVAQVMSSLIKRGFLELDHGESSSSPMQA